MVPCCDTALFFLRPNMTVMMNSSWVQAPYPVSAWVLAVASHVCVVLWLLWGLHCKSPIHLASWFRFHIFLAKLTDPKFQWWCNFMPNDEVSNFICFECFMGVLWGRNVADCSPPWWLVHVLTVVCYAVWEARQRLVGNAICWALCILKKHCLVLWREFQFYAANCYHVWYECCT